MNLISPLKNIFIFCVLCSVACMKGKLEGKKEEKITGTNSFSSNNCRLVATAAMVHLITNKDYWLNTLIKWYDQQGKLTHLKVLIPREWWMYQKQFYLDYGELRYENDMVYLKNVYYDRTIMKVKLDNKKRPKMSWFLDSLDYGWSTQFLVGDTSEYFYLADGKLDSVHSKFNNLDYPWHFVYDEYGNVLRIETTNSRVNFKYDYSKPTNGMAPDYLFSIPLKLMEFMDLIKFPHHHQLTRVLYGSYWPGAPYEDETYPVYHWAFYDVQSNPDGTVRSYRELDNYPEENSIYYNAWDCGANQNILSLNPTQQEFLKAIHY